MLTHSHTQYRQTHTPGVWISVSRHSPKLRVVRNFHSLSQKTTGPIYRNCQWEGRKTLARLANGFVFLLANPEFYSHLVSWSVVKLAPLHTHYMACCAGGDDQEDAEGDSWGAGWGGADGD
jgi:hypothetical protein